MRPKAVRLSNQVSFFSKVIYQCSVFVTDFMWNSQAHQEGVNST